MSSATRSNEQNGNLVTMPYSSKLSLSFRKANRHAVSVLRTLPEVKDPSIPFPFALLYQLLCPDIPLSIEEETRLEKDHTIYYQNQKALACKSRFPSSILKNIEKKQLRFYTFHTRRSATSPNAATNSHILPNHIIKAIEAGAFPATPYSSQSSTKPQPIDLAATVADKEALYPALLYSLHWGGSSALPQSFCILIWGLLHRDYQLTRDFCEMVGMFRAYLTKRQCFLLWSVVMYIGDLVLAWMILFLCLDGQISPEMAALSVLELREMCLDITNNHAAAENVECTMETVGWLLLLRKGIRAFIHTTEEEVQDIISGKTSALTLLTNANNLILSNKPTDVTGETELEGTWPALSALLGPTWVRALDEYMQHHDTSSWDHWEMQQRALEGEDAATTSPVATSPPAQNTTQVQPPSSVTATPTRATPQRKSGSDNPAAAPGVNTSRAASGRGNTSFDISFSGDIPPPLEESSFADKAANSVSGDTHSSPIFDDTDAGTASPHPSPSVRSTRATHSAPSTRSNASHTALPSQASNSGISPPSGDSSRMSDDVEQQRPRAAPVRVKRESGYGLDTTDGPSSRNDNSSGGRSLVNEPVVRVKMEASMSDTAMDDEEDGFSDRRGGRAGGSDDRQSLQNRAWDIIVLDGSDDDSDDDIETTDEIMHPVVKTLDMDDSEVNVAQSRSRRGIGNRKELRVKQETSEWDDDLEILSVTRSEDIPESEYSERIKVLRTVNDVRVKRSDGNHDNGQDLGINCGNSAEPLQATAPSISANHTSSTKATSQTPAKAPSIPTQTASPADSSSSTAPTSTLTSANGDNARGAPTSQSKEGSAPVNGAANSTANQHQRSTSTSAASTQHTSAAGAPPQILEHTLDRALPSAELYKKKLNAFLSSAPRYFEGRIPSAAEVRLLHLLPLHAKHFLARYAPLDTNINLLHVHLPPCLHHYLPHDAQVVDCAITSPHVFEAFFHNGGGDDLLRVLEAGLPHSMSVTTAWAAAAAIFGFPHIINSRLGLGAFTLLLDGRHMRLLWHIVQWTSPHQLSSLFAVAAIPPEFVPALVKLSVDVVYMLSKCKIVPQAPEAASPWTAGEPVMLQALMEAIDLNEITSDLLATGKTLFPRQALCVRYPMWADKPLLTRDHLESLFTQSPLAGWLLAGDRIALSYLLRCKHFIFTITSLSNAIMQSNLTEIHTIVRAGVIISTRSDRFDPLLLAYRRDLDQGLRFDPFIRYRPSNIVDYKQIPAPSKQGSMLHYLLEARVDPNIIYADKQNVVEQALVLGDPGAIQLLLDYGLRPDGVRVSYYTIGMTGWKLPHSQNFLATAPVDPQEPSKTSGEVLIGRRAGVEARSWPFKLLAAQRTTDTYIVSACDHALRPTCTPVVLALANSFLMESHSCNMEPRLLILELLLQRRGHLSDVVAKNILFYAMAHTRADVVALVLSYMRDCRAVSQGMLDNAKKILVKLLDQHDDKHDKSSSSSSSYSHSRSGYSSSRDYYRSSISDDNIFPRLWRWFFYEVRYICRNSGSVHLVRTATQQSLENEAFFMEMRQPPSDRPLECGKSRESQAIRIVFMLLAAHAQPTLTFAQAIQSFVSNNGLFSRLCRYGDRTSEAYHHLEAMLVRTLTLTGRSWADAFQKPFDSNPTLNAFLAAVHLLVIGRIPKPVFVPPSPISGPVFKITLDNPGMEDSIKIYRQLCDDVPYIAKLRKVPIQAQPPHSPAKLNNNSKTNNNQKIVVIKAKGTNNDSAKQQNNNQTPNKPPTSTNPPPVSTPTAPRTPADTSSQRRTDDSRTPHTPRDSRARERSPSHPPRAETPGMSRSERQRQRNSTATPPAERPPPAAPATASARSQPATTPGRNPPQPPQTANPAQTPQRPNIPPRTNTPHRQQQPKGGPQNATPAAKSHGNAETTRGGQRPPAQAHANPPTTPHSNARTPAQTPNERNRGRAPNPSGIQSNGGRSPRAQTPSRHRNRGDTRKIAVPNRNNQPRSTQPTPAPNNNAHETQNRSAGKQTPPVNNPASAEVAKPQNSGSVPQKPAQNDAQNKDKKRKRDDDLSRNGGAVGDAGKENDSKRRKTDDTSDPKNKT